MGAFRQVAGDGVSEATRLTLAVAWGPTQDHQAVLMGERPPGPGLPKPAIGGNMPLAGADSGFRAVGRWGRGRVSWPPECRWR